MFPRSFTATAVLSLLWISHAVAVPSASDRLAASAVQVEALPETGSPEKLKKVVLRVAVERAKKCLEARDEPSADRLLADVAGVILIPAAKLATPIPGAKWMGSMRPVPVKEGNPYVTAMVAGVPRDLGKPDFEFPKATPSAGAFGVLPANLGARNIAAQMEALLWLFANPASPLHEDPAVLKLYLRRALAFVDTLDLQKDKAQAGKDLLDDFSIGPASGALREFAQLYPGLLMPSQKQQWDRAMRIAADAMYGKAKGREGKYANIDLALAYELTNFGLYFDNQTYLDQAKFLIEAQVKNLYPDGAVSYIGSQNETFSYQLTCRNYLTRYHNIWGDATSASLLRGMQPYAQITGRLPDWWTAPAWKHMWNADCEPLRTIPPPVPKDNRHWEEARLWVEDYPGKITPVALPDGYTVLDRNVLGPRAWYDRWNYVATLRPIAFSEPGLTTLMGAQIADPDNRLNASLMGVYPRVLFKNEKNKENWAWLTSGMKAALTMGRSFSALSASYEMAAYGSSTKGEVAPGWTGQQVWLGLPDRIVGYMVASPTNGAATALEVGAIVRLGFGGTVTGAPKTLVTRAPGHFQYGDLVINVHDHNYGSFTPEVVPFRLPQAPVTEITFRDAAALKSGGKSPQSYAANAPLYSVVEVRPAWARGEAKVSRVSSPDGLTGIKVECEGKRFTVWANFTAHDVAWELPRDAVAAAGTSLHPSQDPANLNGVTATPIQPAPQRFSVKPHEQIVLVESRDAADHLKGWTNFPELLASHPASVTP